MDVRKIDEVDLSPYDTVFHLANIANDPSVELNPYSSWEVNVLAGMRLVDRAARHGVKQFVFASSASVYGLKSEPRVTEELELFPLSEYNKTKMVAERVVLSYSDSMVIDRHPPGHGVRLLAADAARPHREPADDAGADERGGHRAGRRADAAEHAHRRPRRRLPLRATIAASPASTTPASRISACSTSRKAVTREVPASIDIKPSNDPRSYSVCSDKFLATGFAPKRNVQRPFARSPRPTATGA